MAVISIFTARFRKRARPNKCAPYVLRRGGGLWFLWVNISRTVCVLNIFSSTKQSKSKWMESFFFFSLDTIKVILVFNHLVCLKPHVGSWQTNTTSLLKPPVRWRLHISISLPIQPYIRSGLSLFSWKHQDTTFSSARPEPYLSFPNPSLWKRMGVGLCDVQDPCRHLHEVRGRSRLCVVEEVVVPPHCMLSC